MTFKKQQWKVAVLGAFLFLGGLAAAEAANQVTDGDFEIVTFPPTGWIVRNQSTSIGTNATCWNRTTTLPPHGGTASAVANFNCTTGTDTISGWLIAPHLVALQNGNQLSFWTITAGSFPDRMQVRLCLDGAPDSCGAAGSTGTTDADVGSFTALLLDINPTLINGVYPTVFTQFTVTLSGLPAGPNAGRIAFRYFVTNGGPSGANSNRIQLDDVVLTDTVPVELMTFEVS